MFGFGLYHTSVGIYDLEVSYGGHDEDTSGIVVVDKGNNAGLELKESLAVGITYYSADEIDEIIDNFGEFWHGRDYDPFSKNCNTFTEHMIKSICEKEQFYVPSYVNRFTKLGSVLRMWFKPLQELVGDIVNYGDSESASSDEQYMPRIKVQQNRSISSQEDPDRSAQPTNIPINQDIKHTKESVDYHDDIEKGLDISRNSRKRSEERKYTTPDMAAHVEDANHVLSMHADIISVLSGHSHSRSGLNKVRRPMGERAPMSQSNYMENNHVVA